MHPLDLGVLLVYLTAVVWLGAHLGRRQSSVRGYFLTGRDVPWWAVLGSIVATETSTVTLISVPGYAFAGDLTFLQLALGYLAGKLFVALVLIPRFFAGSLLTAYQPLTQRFGGTVGRLSALVFLATRALSDGFRLFATGLVLATLLATLPVAVAVATTLLPGLDVTTALVVVSVGVVGATTLAYTLLGGMIGVIWADVLQLCIYTVGTLFAGLILLHQIPGGWVEVTTVARHMDKLTLFDFSLDATRSYTFWSGLVGGMFLTAGTHGTDQMFVQRYLCSRSSRDASRALVWSGGLVLLQFAGFLAIGLMLWVYYQGYAVGELDSLTVDGVIQADRVFPAFLITHLPVGLRGLLVAAVVAAAMSTLSSSLNSAAASTLGDFYAPATGQARSDRHYLVVSRYATAAWAVVQVLVALVAIELSTRVVDEVLGIQSFTGGLLLGMFLLALTTTRRPEAALGGLATGTTVLVLLRLLTSVSWQWYGLVGSLTTCGVGWTLARLWPAPPSAPAPPPSGGSRTP